MEEIERTILNCHQCWLSESRIKAVPGEGSLGAEVMFVGEAPGAEEDKTGRPFVGKSGRLLSLMINRLNLTRSSVFITNVVKCRPPNNRIPTLAEVEACRKYLSLQIQEINPKVIILLGNVPLFCLLNRTRVSDHHGKFYEQDGRTYFVTCHPSAALRDKDKKWKRILSDDFLILGKYLKEGHK